MEGMVGIFIWNPISERQVLGRNLGELKTGSAILNSSKTLLSIFWSLSKQIWKIFVRS